MMGNMVSESSAVSQDVNKQGCEKRFTSFEMLNLSLRSSRISRRYNHCAKLDCCGCCSFLVHILNRLCIPAKTNYADAV